MPRSRLLRLKAAVRTRLGLPPALVTAEVLGRRLTVRDGSVRARPDYDDAWCLACAVHSRVVFDVGANAGQAALPMLVSGVPELVVLIDANPLALAEAAENIFRNGLWTRARFVCAFAGARGGDRIRFWTVGTGSAGSFCPQHAVTASRTGSKLDVPTATLDELANWLGVTPDFVKIDVEGAESMVLDGSAAIAEGRRTRFLVEMHSNPELPMVQNATRVIGWCIEAGYKPWYLAKMEPLESPEQIRHRGRCHLLLQPDGWLLPEWLKALPQSAPLGSVGV